MWLGWCTPFSDQPLRLHRLLCGCKAFFKNNFQLTAAFLDVFAVRHLSRPSFFFFLCTTNFPLQSSRTFSTINRSRMLRVNCRHLLKFQGLDFYTVHWPEDFSKSRSSVFESISWYWTWCIKTSPLEETDNRVRDQRAPIKLSPLHPSLSSAI